MGSLSASDLIAPTYLVVVGTKTGEGVIITRDRKTEEHPIKLSEKGYLIQVSSFKEILNTVCSAMLITGLKILLKILYGA